MSKIYKDVIGRMSHKIDNAGFAFDMSNSFLSPAFMVCQCQCQCDFLSCDGATLILLLSSSH